MTRELTDKEIVKALEVCKCDNGCDACPCFIKNMPCITSSDSDINTVLNFIHRLQSEKKLAERASESYKTIMDGQNKMIDEQNAEIERLTEENKCLTGYVELFEKGEIVSPIMRDEMLALEKDKIELQEENGQLMESINEFRQEVITLNNEKFELQKQVDELKARDMSEMRDLFKAETDRLIEKAEQQAVKDTAKEILEEIVKLRKEEHGMYYSAYDYAIEIGKRVRKKYGVEVE